jgi:ABC-type glycerol-3-phosphate transport system permease component
MTNKLQSRRPILGGLPHVQLSKSTRRRIRLTITYTLLIAGSVTMIFPLFWMLMASFKPEWQILTNPPIWIPSEWIHARAGDTTKEIVCGMSKIPEGIVASFPSVRDGIRPLWTSTHWSTT